MYLHGFKVESDLYPEAAGVLDIIVDGFGGGYFLYFEGVADAVGFGLQQCIDIIDEVIIKNGLVAVDALRAHLAHGIGGDDEGQEES